MTATKISYFAAHDGLSIRYGIWPTRKASARAMVVLLGGRKEFLEKYFETINDLNTRGFDVVSMDWRGQGLSGRMLRNRHKGFVDDYASYLNDLHQFVQKVVMPRDVLPTLIIGHSMGGHIALRYLHRHPDMFHAAILTTPMVNIRLTPPMEWFARRLSRLAAKFGFVSSYATLSRDYRSDRRVFAQNKYTSDPVRFQIDSIAIRSNRELALGGVTFGWLAASFRSIDRLAQLGYAEAIPTPILMIQAGDDRVVSNTAMLRLCQRLPACRCKKIPNARHEVFMEADAIRQKVWHLFDGFVNSVLTAAQPTAVEN